MIRYFSMARSCGLNFQMSYSMKIHQTAILVLAATLLSSCAADGSFDGARIGNGLADIFIETLQETSREARTRRRDDTQSSSYQQEDVEYYPGTQSSGSNQQRPQPSPAYQCPMVPTGNGGWRCQ
jgi:hypothetical protein